MRESKLKNILQKKGVLAYLVDDENIQGNLEAIHNDYKANKIWEEMDKSPNPEFHKLLDKEVSFKAGKLNLTMSYSVEPLFDNPRFEVIEYTPTSRVVRVLNKILG